jgi:hypothetical protein
MEYRGMFYLVFRSSTPNIWTWSVDLDPETIESGEATSRKAAIMAAERLIDKSFLPKKPRLAGVLLRLPGKLP